MKTRSVEAVVTFLEMAAPPARLTRKPAADGLALTRVERIPLHYYRYLYRTVGAPWLWFERLLLDDQGLSERIHRAGVEVFVLGADGAPAGYYELDFADPRSVALVYFGLMQEWTGRGIGGWFLASAIAEGFGRGAEMMRVNTCTLDHPAALPLYQKVGFRPVSNEIRVLRVPAHLDLPQRAAGSLKP